MNDASYPPAPPARAWAVFHRELLRLVLLMAAGVVAFLVTRALAISNEAVRRSDAVRWHDVGTQAIEAGNSGRALDALRRAARIDSRNRDIAISLARALRSAHEDLEAVAVLEALLESHPDDAEATTELARLEAGRGAMPLAIRYYQDALDAMWMPEAADRRRAVREEFIALLRQHGERARALSQVLVLSADVPAEAAWQMKMGRLFLAVGDPRRALDRFTAVLNGEPRNADALAGAGRAAFAMGDYVQARKYFSTTSPTDPETVQVKEVADALFTADPLTARLSRPERERRLQVIFQHAAERLDRCGSAADTDPTRAAIRTDLSSLRPAPAGRRSAEPDERDRTEEGVALALRVEQATASCGPTDGLGRAIPYIARLHGLEESR